MASLIHRSDSASAWGIERDRGFLLSHLQAHQADQGLIATLSVSSGECLFSKRSRLHRSSVCF